MKTMKTVGAASLAPYLGLLLSSTTVTDVRAQPFDGCAADGYYQPLIDEFGTDPSSWTREAVQSLLESTHRNVLPIQDPGSDDVYTALIDLWPGDQAETVHLVYRDIDYPATPYANSQTWSRGNVWPEDRRTGFDAAADSDVHGNVPADTTVFASKGDLQFGQCGTVQIEELCSPLPEAADTLTDGKIWEPPETARGSQARMVMYLAVRYGGDISDCPPFGENTLAYRSQLLQWHSEYPPDEQEVARNSEACERWQGNRNIFVDYPQLAEAFFGGPDALRDGYMAYEGCFGNDGLIATMAPTAAPNACQDVQPGDIQLFLANSEDTDQLAFFTIDRIPHAVESIYVTDRPWDGSRFLETSGDGTLMVC